MLRYELHAHVTPSSPCAKVGADEFLRRYVAKGYDGVVITNHIWPAYEALKLPWPEAVDCFLTPWRDALAMSADYGLHVLLGVELRVDESPNDYLLYGFDPSFLYESGNLTHYKLAELSQHCKAHGVAIFQAHPFRNGMKITRPDFVDGYEILNGHAGHDSRNEIAQAWCERFDKIGIGGSDFHLPGGEGQSGVLLARRPENEAELARMLLARAFSIIPVVGSQE